MSVTVKRATLWRTEKANSPGALAATLAPLAQLREDLQIVIGYAYPDRQGAAIEVYPVRSKSAQRAATKVGLSECHFPCLVVTGKNRPGLTHQITDQFSEAGINLNFFIGQVIGKQYTALFGFEADSEADLAVKLIRKITGPMNGGTPRASAASKKKTTAKRRRVGAMQR